MKGCVPGVRRAFTLIELLVVIAIIALLIGILLPALGNARKTSKMAVEMGSLQQVMRGYASYANDHKGRVLPGYIHWTWAHPYNGTDPFNRRVSMRAPDDRGAGVAISGSGYAAPLMEGYVVKSWPWRFFAWVGNKPEALIIDKATLAEFRSRPAPLTGYDAGTTWQRAFAWHPAFGLNGIYVGGDHMNQAFNHPGAQDVQLGPNRRFFVRGIEEVNRPDRLIVFGSARSKDINGSNETRPGHYLIPPPKPHPVGRLSQSAALGGGWSSPNNTYSPSAPIQSWGEASDALGRPHGLDMRHFNKAAVAKMDGHVTMHNLAELRDMTRWSNNATRADWNFRP